MADPPASGIPAKPVNWGCRGCLCFWCWDRRGRQGRNVGEPPVYWRCWYEFVTAHYSPAEVAFSVKIADFNVGRDS